MLFYWKWLSRILLLVLSQRTVDPLVVNSRGLTILSFYLVNNNDTTPSKWVQHVLGNKGIVTFKSPSPHQLPPLQSLLSNRSQSFRKHALQLPSAVCAIELLGVVPDNWHGEINAQPHALNIGSATLDMFASTWGLCHYRATLDNWRKGKRRVMTIMLYCPQHDKVKCADLQAIQTNNDQSSLVGKVTVRGQISSFETHLSNIRTNPTGADDGKRLAACLVLPYASTTPHMRKINGHMLVEWIKYYTKLGFDKLFIYDRDGQHEEWVSSASPAHHADRPQQRVVEYHNNTLHGLLYRHWKQQRVGRNRARNISSPRPPTPPTNERSIHETDNDKTDTLTWCRAEARAVHRITTVLVVDFDEFILCPFAAPHAAAQRRALDALIRNNRRGGVHQINLRQQLPANATANVTACLERVVNRAVGGGIDGEGNVGRGGDKKRGDKIRGDNNRGNNNRGDVGGQAPSLLSCYASIDYPLFDHATKAIHTTYSCPVTDFHGACASDRYTSTDLRACISPLSHACACPMSFDDFPPRSVCSLLPGYDALYNAVRGAMPDRETVCTVVHFYRSEAVPVRWYRGRFGVCGGALVERIRASVNEIEAILHH